MHTKNGCNAGAISADIAANNMAQEYQRQEDEKLLAVDTA
eukprot:COSAG02_NODE_11140_length_1784_cov_3.138279_2_plen_39_part_01